MGDLATQYGYYGAEWGDNMDDVIAEAGEVSDLHRYASDHKLKS